MPTPAFHPSQTRLILAVHGAESVAHSGEAAEYQALQIQGSGLFGAVQTAYLKKAPFLDEAVAQAKEPVIVILPFFTSAGYFTRDYIPKKLGLDGQLTRREGRCLIYGEPTGMLPEVPAMIAQQVKTLIETHHLDPNNLQIMVVGHGTSKNPDSGHRTREISAYLESLRLGQYYHTCFIEMEPFLKDWKSSIYKETLIVVPFFISPGLHASVDIPTELKIYTDKSPCWKTGPYYQDSLTLWYLPCFGYEKCLSDYMIQQINRLIENNLAF